MIINYKYLFAKNISTIFSLGYLSKMPGTLGSIVGLIIGVILLKNFSFEVFIYIFLILLLISFFAVNEFQKKNGYIDKSEIIIDEFIGQLIPLIFININFVEIILSFILFRFFDIFKIFPANFIDKKFTNFFGVMFDDIIAGIQSSIVIIIFKNTYERLL